jgi:hypothetical protein
MACACRQSAEFSRTSTGRLAPWCSGVTCPKGSVDASPFSACSYCLKGVANTRDDPYGCPICKKAMIAPQDIAHEKANLIFAHSNCG